MVVPRSPGRRPHSLLAVRAVQSHLCLNEGVWVDLRTPRRYAISTGLFGGLISFNVLGNCDDGGSGTQPSCRALTSVISQTDVTPTDNNEPTCAASPDPDPAQRGGRKRPPLIVSEEFLRSLTPWPGRHPFRRHKSPLCGAFSYGPGRDRTCDLGIKSPLLYQLSYRPVRPSVDRGRGAFAVTSIGSATASAA